MKVNEKVNDAFDVALGQVIRQHRKECKLTMEQIAEKVGVTQQMISLYELGKAAITVMTLKNICELLDITYTDAIREAVKVMEDGTI